jgi:AcrR family transcriptional regulator
VQPPAAARPRRGRPRVVGTEQRILDTALAMLAASGYAALRLDELARRAGVAKTTVLRRWPSKAAVVAAAVERLALHTVEVPESSTLRDDLHALLSNAATVFGHGPGRFVPRLLREAGRHPEIAELLQTVIHTRRMGYRRAVGRAIARGELDPEIDQELLIDLLIGPLWTRLLITHDPLPPSIVDDIVAAVLRAYPAPPGTRVASTAATSVPAAQPSTAAISLMRTP